MAGNTLATPVLQQGGYPGGGLSYQGGSNDSLTNFIRSIESLTGAQGQGILGAGLSRADEGVKVGAPALDFLTKLVKGDQADVTQAAQPEIDQITQQFDQIRNMISMQPRGGGKTTALAEAPFKKAGEIQRTEGDLRKGAASALSTESSRLAGIGLEEASLGAGLEKESANIALTKEGQDYGQKTTLDQIIDAVNAFI